MSYDLFFDRVKPLAAEEFFAYFTGRRNYKIQNRQAWYQNDQTGVYFSFLAADPEKRGETEERSQPSFNMNLCRPHFFGLEAEPELSAFIRHFEVTVRDPQAKSPGPFAVEMFVSNWNSSNEFGYKALLASREALTKVRARPSAELEAIWRWNYGLPRIQAELGTGTFVPRIVWMNVEGVLNSAAVWPDGIATLIPAVELLIIPRDQLAPRNLLWSRQKDLCLADQSALDQCLAPLQAGRYPLPCRTPAYLRPTEDVKRFVRGLSAEKRKMEGVAMDQVLNLEMVPA